MTNEHSNIMLMGLKGSHPLGALAAFGLLRCLSETSEFGTPRLHWELQDDWLAVLTFERLVSHESVVSCLIERTKQWDNRYEFTWADKIDTEHIEFVKAALDAVYKATMKDRERVDFFSAFGCELVVNKGKLRPTAFQMTSGNQSFLKIIHDLAKSLSKLEKIIELVRIRRQKSLKRLTKKN